MAEEALIAAIRKHPHEGALRLVHADWPDGRGDVCGGWLIIQMFLNMCSRWSPVFSSRRSATTAGV
ncbi:TIGR02996 domain-containing protein [bacterium]|nr:TIGR02996 domain-containing protein [bacterium]